MSDALGLGGDRAWSALASPSSPPSLSSMSGVMTVAGRADSVPPTPVAGAHLALQPVPRPPRPSSALPDREPDLVDPGKRLDE